MAYASEDDLNFSSQRLIELTDNEEAVGEQDDELLDRLLVESETIVNAALAGEFTVPFVTVPAIIKVITSWIWRYRIYCHREVMEVPKSVLDDYTRAMEWLKALASGDMPIGPDVDDEPGPTPSGQIDIESSCPRGWTHRSATRV